MLIIDKKKMKLKDANLPKMVLEQTPKYLRGSKMPIVKAKIGPRIMTLMADPVSYTHLDVYKRQVPIHVTHSLTLSMVSTGEYVNVSPKKSLTCPITIVTAIPKVKPDVIVYGMKRIKFPNFKSPIIIRRIPAITVATTRPSIWCSATIPVSYTHLCFLPRRSL